MRKTIHAILIWKFDEAPTAYRDLTSRDDMTWVAILPPEMQEEPIPSWMSGFGSSGLEEYWIRSGSRVILG